MKREDMKKYRVLKHHGLYRIQIEQTTQVITGYLWWRKEIEIKDWVSVNSFGSPCRRYRSIGIVDIPLYPLRTLDEAKAKIKVWLEPDEIIYP